MFNYMKYGRCNYRFMHMSLLIITNLILGAFAFANFCRLTLRIFSLIEGLRMARGFPSAHADQVPVPGFSITLREWRTMLLFRKPTPQRPNCLGSSHFSTQ